MTALDVRAPAPPVAPAPLLFAPVLHAWAHASGTVAPHSGSFAPGVARSTLGRWQTEALYTLHLRALACHLSLLSREGALRGATPEERYERYCSDFTARHAAEFDACFAPLVALRAEVLAQHADALRLLGAQLDADRAGLAARFGIGTDARVTRVDDGGDTHDGARRVCLLTFDDGHRIVHKPRAVSGEHGWEQLAAWLAAEHAPHAPPAARAWDLRSHGWVEFVPALARADEARLLNDPEFLARGGALMAVLHALNAKDMHRDNLRATAAGPMPLDLETVLHVAAPVGTHPDPDDVWVALGSSVSAMGVLPTAVPAAEGQRAGWVDVGFLATQAGGGNTLRSLTVLNPYRDDLRLSFEPDDAWEHPFEHRTKEETVAAASAVADGFTRMYRWLADRRDAFADATARAFAGARLRYLHGQTQDYVNVVRLSCAAEAMADTADRDERLRRVGFFSPDGDPALTDAEVAQLRLGHVPLFTMDVDSTVVRDGAGHRIASAAQSPLDAARDKIAALGPADLAQQLDLLWAAFVALHPDDHLASVSPAPGPAPSYGVDDGIAALARSITDDLVARARPDGEPVRAPSWLGPVPSTDAIRPWAAGALDFDLYTGRTGVALALAQASVALDHAGARRVATRVFDACAASLATELDLITEQLGAGAWTGAAGLPLALDRAGVLLGRPDWRAAAADASGRLAVPDGLDIIDGLAGSVLAAAALGSPHADAEHALIEALAGAPDDGMTLLHSGYAHGIAGVLHALASSALGDSVIAPHVSTLLGRLESLRTPDGAAWYASGLPDPQVATAWCHGAAGIALGLGAAHRARPTLVPADLVDVAVAALASDGYGRNLTLCHGDPGNWAIATWLATTLGDERAERAASDGRGVLSADAIAAQLADRRNRNSLNDTLMLGRAGVLLHLSARLDPALGSAPLTPPTTGGTR